MTMFKCYYIAVRDTADGEALDKFLSELAGRHFITEAPVPGTLDDVYETLQESFTTGPCDALQTTLRRF